MPKRKIAAKRCFSLSSEATEEGKFGRVAGNIGIRCRQPWLVAANHQAFSLVFLPDGKSTGIGSQSVNTGQPRRKTEPAVIRSSYAIFLHREKAYSQEFCETPDRSPSSISFGNAA